MKSTVGYQWAARCFAASTLSCLENSAACVHVSGSDLLRARRLLERFFAMLAIFCLCVGIFDRLFEGLGVLCA